jgi:hypothetical protein
MTPPDLQKLTTAELIDRFANDGVAQDKALLYDEIDAFNNLMDEMNVISKELGGRGEQARLELLSLYNHPNIQVRLQAARASLPVAPIAARNEIEAIANSRHFPQAGDAGMTLRFLKRSQKP